MLSLLLGHSFSLCSLVVGVSGSKEFDSKGDVQQVDYARKAAHETACAWGLVCGDGVVLATRRCSKRPGIIRSLQEEPRSVHRIDADIGAALIGIPSDQALVVSFLQEIARAHRARFAQAIRCQDLADALASYLHDLTTSGDARPLAVHVLIGSGRAGVVYEVDPAGAMRGVEGATLINRDVLDHQGARTLCEKDWSESTCDEAVRCVLGCWVREGESSGEEAREGEGEGEGEGGRDQEYVYHPQQRVQIAKVLSKGGFIRVPSRL